MLSTTKTEINKGFRKIQFLQFFILFCFAFILFGCGKKGPPVPPRQITPPRVKDLTGDIKEDSLRLTWTIPQRKEFISSGAKGFFVYRSKTLLSEPDCKSCPVLFTRVADIPIEVKSSGDLDKDKIIYNETLEKGNRYIYKVNVYAKGITGSDSNYVDFVFK